MSDYVTISFVGTKKLKALLERWAKDDDRSVSYILRWILIKESERRQVEKQQRANP